MRRLTEMIRNLKGVDDKIVETVQAVLKEHEALIVDMNVEGQLFEKGITREGVKISSYAPYTPRTVEIKREKGQPTSRVTLRDTEDFHKSFFVDFGRDEFEIKASDSKAERLKFEYGEQIMGLTKENREELAVNYIQPAVRKVFAEL